LLGLFVALAAAATAPVPSMTNDWWSDYYDWPSKGLAPGEASVVMAEITVNTNGYFANCVGHAYLGNPMVAPYVCSRLKNRALFKPARAADGRKIIGIYRKLIIVANVSKEFRFTLPKFGIRLHGKGRGVSDNPFEIQFYLDGNGVVSDCSLIDSIGINLNRHKQVIDPAYVQQACADVPRQIAPVPPRDKNGNGIPTVQNALVVVDDQDFNPSNQ
jgi:hypothetical protein